jgi:hypothetical protein
MKKLTNYRFRALYIVLITVFLLFNINNNYYGDYEFKIYKYFFGDVRQNEMITYTIDLNIIGVLLKVGLYIASPFAIYFAMLLWNKKPKE